ncbi:hypothetical protein CerSpe_214060 [Prunus speciosa]
MVRRTRRKVYMAESTQATDERNKGIVETESMESSTEYPFERLEKAMREGFQTMTTSMANSMNHMSQSIVQTVKKGHENTTLQGNETRAHLSQIFERIIRMAQEEDAPRKEKGLLENENTPSGAPRYSPGQTSGHANSTSPKMVIGSSSGTPFQVANTGASDRALVGQIATQASSPSKEPGGQWFAPSDTSSKYQAPKTGEAALPPGPVRKNMYAEKWREPTGFNVHIAHNNGNSGGNGRARRDHTRIAEQSQDSDDEDEAGQNPQATIEPPPVRHPNEAIRNEIEGLRQLVYNGQAGIRRAARPTYQKPYPAYIDDLPFPRGFKVPNFSLFNGEDLYASGLEHIGRFSAQCVAIETQPLLKLRLFGSSLSSQAFTWYSNLSPNSITGWAEMEGAFMEQYYRPEPEVTINDLTDMKQGEHETVQDFIARFKKLKMKCKIPMDEKHFIKMAQNALRLSLRKKFDDQEFMDLQDVAQRAGKYELLLQEETQRRNSSKPVYFKNPVLHLEVINEFAEANEESVGPEVSLAEIVQIKNPITCKAVIRPGKEQRSNPPPTGGFVPYKQKHKSYSFDLSKAENIFDELLRGKVIKLDEKHVFPKQEEVKGKLFCKWHNSFSHAINNCVQFSAIQDLINEGKILLDKPTSVRVDNEPFPTHMVGVNWPERQNKRRIVVGIEKARKASSSLIEKPRATITTGIVMCSRCKCECELEIPAAGGNIDERLLQNTVGADQDYHRSEARNYGPFTPRQGPKGNFEKF